ncbi:MAG: DUF2927 domain-containing protein [Aestuariivirga sp.]
MHRYRNSHKFNFFVCIKKISQYFLFVVFWCVSSASADSIADGKLLSNAAKIYLHQSLNNSDQRLRKISKIGPITVKSTCLSISQHQCAKSVLNSRFNNAIVIHLRLKLTFLNKIANPDIEIMYVDHSIALSKRRNLSVAYAKEFRDSDDSDCQLYYAFKKHSIERIAIVVSLDSPDFKQRVCLMSQLHQSIGLSLLDNLPFSELWKKRQGGYSTLTGANFAQLVQTFGILSYIHMCSELTPGMNNRATVGVLSKGSKCFLGLNPSTSK